MLKIRLSQLRTGSPRTQKYKTNTLIMLLCQFLSMASSFIMVPLVMGYLGVDNYGIWLTLWGLIEWCNVFDVGLGHGLRNKYAEAKAIRDIDSARKYVSTTFFVLLLIGATLFIAFFISAKLLNWSNILNAPSNFKTDLQTLVMFIGGFFCVKFVANIVNIILTADQNPGISSIITLVSNLLALVGVYILTEHTKPSILLLGVCVTGLQLLPILVAAILLFAGRYKVFIPRFSQFRYSYIKDIFTLGIQFFVIQITAMLLFAFNNIIISHTCGNGEVTEFNIAYKYMNILYIVFLTLITPLWSASTEAYSRGDLEWIYKTFKKVNSIWILMTLGGVLMIVASPLVYTIWIKNSIEPNYLLLTLMLVYMSLWMRYTLYRTFMNGVGKIRLQFYITTIESLLHIPIAIIMGNLFGIYGVLCTMIIWAFINFIWEPLQFKKIITHTAEGLWNK